MFKLQSKRPATWNHKYPDKTGCHTHSQQIGLLPGTILAAPFSNPSLGKSAQVKFLFVF